MRSTVERSGLRGWLWLLLIVGLIVCTPATATAELMFTTIGAPGASSTDARGINDAGQIVGSFANATGVHGFLNTGVFTTFDPPGARATQTFSINDAGQIVGFFFDGTSTHGFLAAMALVLGRLRALAETKPREALRLLVWVTQPPIWRARDWHRAGRRPDPLRRPFMGLAQLIQREEREQAWR
jgi:uncharacterized membrane protein